jgi:hypothetical protein
MKPDEINMDANPETSVEELKEPIVVLPSGRCMQINKDMILNNDQLAQNVENCKRAINEYTNVIGRITSGSLTDEEIDNVLDKLTSELTSAGLFKITEYINHTKSEMIVLMASSVISFFSTILYVAAADSLNTEVESEPNTVTE